MSIYYYLVSSLPTLSLWEKPEIDIPAFMEICSDQLNEHELLLLDEVDLTPEQDKKYTNSTLKKWYNWETCLRNKIARTRSSGNDKDCSPYLHEEKDYFPEVDRIVQEAYGTDTPLQMEKMLDEGRWNRLNELESGHIFDIDLVCIYKLKLLLCEKWKNRKEEQGKENLDKALSELYTEDILKIN